jgi:cytochrome bd-type quinol oxidase subunit 2
MVALQKRDLHVCHAHGSAWACRAAEGACPHKAVGMAHIQALWFRGGLILETIWVTAQRFAAVQVVFNFEAGFFAQACIPLMMLVRSAAAKPSSPAMIVFDTAQAALTATCLSGCGSAIS